MRVETDAEGVAQRAHPLDQAVGEGERHGGSLAEGPVATFRGEAACASGTPRPGYVPAP